ncbi:DUF2617 family protein [Halopiger djelfimassiliensis]|uniref:DUF2617 family protein n=1 Tax=Halopiger djelfimassiliensis TaxID=1293047 RepID=UPI000677FF4B|nr:DUF2617 family protein [Halopiger djelfimassiliensis]
MNSQTLRFVHDDRPPATDGVRVFDSLTRPFLGTEFTFRIIGSSHYISAPAYDFYELSACGPVPGGGCEVTAIPLDPAQPSRRLGFETDTLGCETVVDHRPLSAFPTDRLRSRPDSFDLAYAFDGNPEAVTTIEIGDDGYETYHTYPEFDLALYTRSEFVIADPTADDRTARVPDSVR